MSGTFEVTGGARVGWINATWPLAKLTAGANSLRVVVRVLGDYSFTPDTAVAITRYTRVPVIGWGIQIQHCVPEYPASVIFWCLGRPDALLAGIRQSGFQPRAPMAAIPKRQGFAVRWQAILAAILVWNGLFILDMLFQHRTSPFLGVFSVSAPALAFAAAIATLRWPAFQNLVLKPGRTVGEIRPLLNLLVLVSGFMFVALALTALF